MNLTKPRGLKEHGKPGLLDTVFSLYLEW
jgi:hypothetical protein